MEGETVKCTRDGCDTDIPLIRENLIVLRPEVPLLSAKCPECGKTKILTKDVSIGLVDLYFKDELEELNEIEDESCDGPLMPSKDLSEMVEETLGLLGYKGKTWKDKIKAIVEFVKSGPMYQTPQGLHQLLAAWKVDAQHIPMVVNKVFGATDGQSQMPQYGNPVNVSTPMPNYPGSVSNTPGPVGAGYSMAQAPNGQVIVLPPPTAPTPTVKKTPESDDTIIIEEKLGKKGEVVSRVIKQKATQANAPAAEQKSAIEEFGAMVNLLKDAGVIGNRTEPAPPPPAVSPEIAQTLDKISGVLNTLSNTQSAARVDRDDRDSNATQQYKTEMKELNDEIKQMRDEQHTAEMSSLRSEINALRNNATNSSHSGLNDFQFEIDSKQRNLQTITEAVESTGSKLIEPLIEMQSMQAKLSGMLAIRQLEIADQVPPGTYASAIAPKKELSDDEVSSTLKTWRERADVDGVGEE